MRRGEVRAGVVRRTFAPAESMVATETIVMALFRFYDAGVRRTYGRGEVRAGEPKRWKNHGFRQAQPPLLNHQNGSL